MSEIITFFDEVAGMARAERRFTESAIGGALAEFYQSAAPNTSRERVALARRLDMLRTQIVADANSKITNRIKESVSLGVSDAAEALGATLTADELAIAVKRVWDERVGRLASQQIDSAITIADRSVQRAEQVAMRFALMVQGMVDNGIRPAIAVSEIMTKTPPRVDYTITDARGAAWLAETYLATGLRGAMVESYNQGYIDVSEMAGVYVLEVRHAKGKAGVDGMQFATRTGIAGIPLYAEIRTEVFHPNSKSVVTLLTK